MLFNSAVFVVFLVVTLAVYYATSRLLVRHLVLLVASLVFYAFWDYRFLALVAYVTVVAYGAGHAIHAWPRHGKKVLALAIFLQLGQLVFFKYATFFTEVLQSGATLLGIALRVPRFNILLPVGISFYTFHGISYVVDCHRRKIDRPYGPLVVALYIVFFPQLVAGPIVRADVFLPQVSRVAKLDLRDVTVGLKLATIGLVYKGVFADRLAPFVDTVFAAPSRYDNIAVASATLAFYGQIYFDFAGYSLMAIGISRLFGFRLPRNFDFPYRSTSITEFWRRWHISLSTWLRDYLYIPLGGNRDGKVRQYRNLLLTMLLGGLWHGASYNFLLWGGIHGVALAAHKLFTTWVPAPSGQGHGRPLRIAAGWLLTQGFVLSAWVLFRAKGFPNTWTMLRGLAGIRRDAGLLSATLPLPLLIVPIAVDQLLVQNPRLPAVPWPRRPLLAVAVLGLCLSVVLPLLQIDVQNFIYFQF
jgi:alginate O-acetyltransferase complex protein AlgI